jgi:nucleoid DNA-binding protein
MNQSELIDKVAQATALNQAAAGQAVKAVVNAILDSLVAQVPVRRPLSRATHWHLSQRKIQKIRLMNFFEV